MPFSTNVDAVCVPLRHTLLSWPAGICCASQCKHLALISCCLHFAHLAQWRTAPVCHSSCWCVGSGPKPTSCCPGLQASATPASTGTSPALAAAATAGSAQQPAGTAAAGKPDAIVSDWKEFTSPDGRKYYHNRKTKVCALLSILDLSHNHQVKNGKLKGLLGWCTAMHCRQGQLQHVGQHLPAAWPLLCCSCHSWGVWNLQLQLCC